ncbi:MAG: carbohydrate-binding family 9-like protein, partial [Myxococcota bacterium]
MRSRVRLHALLALVAVLALAAGLAGCRKPRQRAFTKDQERQISAALLPSAPTPQVPINAVFDGKVRLIGVDIEKPEVRPGDTLTITWYWESLAEAPGDWKIFVHLEGPGKRSTHDHGPVGELLPIPAWKPGQIIKDVQTISIMSDFPDCVATLWVGIFDEKAWTERQQNVRMQIVNPDQLKQPKDNDGRVQAGTFKISKSAAAGKSGANDRRPTADTRPRRYTVYRAPGPIAIDGKLDDAGWQGVPLTQAFVKPDGGDPLPPELKTEARLAWDDTYLYVAFTTKDPNIESKYQGRDQTLWDADVCEIYLDAQADGKDYLELQVAPTGEIFDALFATRRTPKWEEAAPAFTMSGMLAKIIADGTINNPGDKDNGWTAEVAIPWAEVPGLGATPPAQTIFAVNLYRLDQTGHG